MKRLTLCSLFLVVGLLFGAERAQAQALIQIGPRIGYEVDVFEGLSIGADLRISSEALPIKINPSVDYLVGASSDFANVFQGAVNGLFAFGIANQTFTPYVGPGVSYTRVVYDDELDIDDATEIGLNLVGGAEFDVGPVGAFAQAEYVPLGDFNPIKVVGGLLLNF